MSDRKRPDNKRVCLGSFHYTVSLDANPYYFNVTLAPSASSLALASSAVALSAASLITLGAPSTASLASFSPRPVNSRTILITLTLFGPTSVNSISNSVFSSAAAASPPAAATTTPAAADTPNSSSHAFTRSFNLPQLVLLLLHLLRHHSLQSD